MKLTQQNSKPARYKIAQLVGQLGRKSPVRLWLESHEEISDGSAWELFDALARTGTNGWVDRAVAFHALGLIDLAPLDREHAGRLLLDAFHKPDIGRASLERFGGALFLTSMGWLTFAVLAAMPLGELPGLLLLILITTPIPLAIQRDNCIKITKRITATALAQVGGPECIVALWAHVQRETQIAEEAAMALKALLPRVSADWYGQLPAGCNDALVEMARWPYQADLALAALDALERAGDGRCADAIARITHRSAAAGVYPRAVAILPTLLARRAREEASTTLLRPSDKISTEHLVRPVYGSEPDTSNLLRASHLQSSEIPPENSAP